MKTSLTFVIIILVAFSCSSQENVHHIEQFRKNQKWFEKTATYLNDSFEELERSSCTDSLGVIKVTTYIVNELSCYEQFKDTLNALLSLGYFKAAELRNRNHIEFIIDFVPNDKKDLETTIFLVFLKGKDSLPDYYQNWVGTKERLTENWWLLEYKNAQF